MEETVSVEEAVRVDGLRDRAAADEPDPPPPDYTRSRELMGTVFQITVVGTPPEEAEPAVRAAFEEMARLEDLLSEWRSDSEISRINDAAGDHAVDVSADTLAVVKAGLDVSRWSNGAFDMSWAAMRNLYDFQAEDPEVPSQDEIDERLAAVDWKAITVDDDQRTVFLERPGMVIGTGGIAKGYALDQAGEILRDAGVESYMLFGGGQVQVRGSRGERPWRVGIQHPRSADDYFAYLEASSGSISTSGDYEHAFFDDEGTRWHHILDPRTGRPARESRSVTVQAATGLYGDALSTAAFVLGPQKAKAMFRDIPHRAEMVMVDPRCRVVSSPGILEHLRLTAALEDDRRLPGCAPAPD
ncbi:MAG: FAD:protein FMN transferase [Myxococcota bacterium]